MVVCFGYIPITDLKLVFPLVDSWYLQFYIDPFFVGQIHIVGPMVFPPGNIILAVPPF
jgi:hypothetical protein